MYPIHRKSRVVVRRRMNERSEGKIIPLFLFYSIHCLNICAHSCQGSKSSWNLARHIQYIKIIDTKNCEQFS